jgi:hypothetical protein
VVQIGCCIDKWSTGVETLKKFTVDEYQDILDSRRTSQQSDGFDENTKEQGLLPKLLFCLHDNGQ